MDYTQLYVDMCHCPNNTLNANPTNKIIIPLKCTLELVGTWISHMTCNTKYNFLCNYVQLQGFPINSYIGVS